ncbi:MAG: hypothetical protein KC657_26175 [Myxococcales bacterium]|nr:hypothetical protein [Myxococcales bacterium]
MLFGARNGRRLVVLLFGMWMVVSWQRQFTRPDAHIDKTYRVWAATGLNKPWEAQFFFFLYHLGIYPLKTDAPILKDTRNEAERLLRAAPEKLKQDEWVTFRSGDRGRVYLFYFDKIVNGASAINPTLKPAHIFAWRLALCALWFAAWWSRRPWLGAALVIALGSNPFQLNVVYNDENVFGWSITAMVLVLAIHLPLMGTAPEGGHRRRLSVAYPWIAAFGTAILMATIRNVRSEPMVVMGGAVFVYLTLSRTSWVKRALLVIALVTTFSLTTRAYAYQIHRKFEQAQKVLVDLGQEPYTGPYRAYHEFWHALYCGLGDFDTKYGYEWNDLKVYRFVYPSLQRWHPELEINPNRAPQSFTYDKAKKYPVYYGEIDERYHDLVKAKVLGDIKNDPRWYADIIKQRIWRILTETTPVTIAYGDLDLQTKSPLFGLLAVPLLGFLAWTRRWFYARLLLFSAPLAAPALIIYSDRGMANYSCIHIFSAVIMTAVFATGLREWAARRRARA